MMIDLTAMNIAVGIDLGTANSCVAVYKNGRVDVIANDEGDRITPSYVVFANEGPIVGKTAKFQESASNLIFDAKRLIGRKYSEIQGQIKNYPFTVVQGNNDSAVFNIKIDHREFIKTPEEISSLVLKKLKDAASDRLGDDFKNEAVITVPAHFNMEQRNATKKAAEMAGLRVLRLLNEPTAAAIAYTHDQNFKTKKTIAVYDFGESTFDVSVIEVDGKQIAVKAIAGDSNLGGKNFNDRLVDKCLQEIKIESDEVLNKRVLRRVREACEEAKKSLSTKLSHKIVLQHIIRGKELFVLQINRTDFEETNFDLFQKTIEKLNTCLSDVGYDRAKIDKVLLVGGSSKIPKIHDLLKDYFGNKISKTINMNKAVVCGAAIQASLLKENPHEAIVDICLNEILSVSLGTDTDGDIMSFLLKNRTSLPAEKRKRYKTINDHQTFMDINILEGENPIASRNNNLGKIVVDGLTPKPKGKVKVQVTFTVNRSGILLVTAKETVDGITEQVKIRLTNNNCK